MAKTIIEKIIAQHTKEEVSPGKIVWMDLDIRSARDFGGPNVVKNYQREYGNTCVDDPQKTYFTFDLCVPACSLKYADSQQICRDFAKKQNVQVFDVDRGIGSHVLIEEGLAGSGKTIVGTDSHMNILGAVGAFGQGMGDVDITFGFRTGKTWFEIPETIKIILKGDLSPSVSAKDLTLYIIKILGTEKAALKAIEFYGEPVRRLSLSGRITLCSMVTEMAGIIGFIPEYEPVFSAEMNTLTGMEFKHVQPDADAVYSEIIEIDVSAIVPQVAAPYLPTNVFDINEVKHVTIDSGFIGSCTNGRIEDYREAALMLKGRKVRDGIMLRTAPATRRVYKELLEEGILQTLFESGVIIGNPGCGGCAEGHMGLTGAGEIQISTGNRNFEGKQGKGRTYLASPAVVAASCILGHIAEPEDI